MNQMLWVLSKTVTRGRLIQAFQKGEGLFLDEMKLGIVLLVHSNKRVFPLAAQTWAIILSPHLKDGMINLPPAIPSSLKSALAFFNEKSGLAILADTLFDTLWGNHPHDEEWLDEIISMPVFTAISFSEMVQEKPGPLQWAELLPDFLTQDAFLKTILKVAKEEVEAKEADELKRAMAQG